MTEVSQAIYNLKMVHKQLIAYYISRNNTKMVRKGIKTNTIVNTVVALANINAVVNTDTSKKIMISFNGEKRERNSQYECNCGVKLLWGGMKLHITTKKHIAITAQQASQPTIQVIEPIPIQICTEVIQPKKIMKKVFRKITRPSPEYDYNQDMLDDHNNGTGVRTIDVRY